MSTKTPAEWRTVLRAIAPNSKPWVIDGFADALPGLCEKYEINTVGRQAHFIAQCAHESDHFKTTTEYASGAAYEGRKDLGNVNKGDGVRFKGRGLIQLTGRYNYASAGYVDDPEAVARFPAAAEVSGWFWARNKLNQHADKDDVRAATKAINGGLNGLLDRTAYLGRAKRALA